MENKILIEIVDEVYKELDAPEWEKVYIALEYFDDVITRYYKALDIYNQKNS